MYLFKKIKIFKSCSNYIVYYIYIYSSLYYYSTTIVVRVLT